MKRLGNVYDKICSMDNIQLAYKKAIKGKRYYKNIRTLEQAPLLKEKFLKEIQQELINQSYICSSYKTKYIYEPKERLIYILPLKDRIVQHAIMNILEDYWDTRMYYHSYSCRKGKGQHAGSRLCMLYTKKYKYCLKCDISKFYPSINLSILYDIVERKIKDKKLLKLLRKIIFSGQKIDFLDPTDLSKHKYRNVPIGNYISQWFGNLYLNELDTYLKRVLRVKAYVRYCDDFCIFSNNKKSLHNLLRDDIIPFLKNKLDLHLSKQSIFPIDNKYHGVDFLGYRHYSGKILLRKSTSKRIIKKLKILISKIYHCKISPRFSMSCIGSIMGWIQHAQTYNFKTKYQISLYKRGIDYYASFCKTCKNQKICWEKSNYRKNAKQTYYCPRLQNHSVQIQQWFVTYAFNILPRKTLHTFYRKSILN